MSLSCSFLIATAETTLSFSSCSITSKSVVTSSAENGNTFSIWIRIISGNSAGSTLGRRNRWASTAETGKPSTKSSVAASSGTASSSVCNLRTFHEPFCSALPAAVSRTDEGSTERTKFQPCAVGIMKIDGIPGSISKLLPAEYLGPANSQHGCAASRCPTRHHLLQHHHFYGARNLT